MEHEYFRPRPAEGFRWAQFGVGVALAGGAMPVLLGMFGLVVTAIFTLVSPNVDLGDFGRSLPILIGLAVVGPFFATPIAGCVALLVLPVLSVLVALLGIRVRQTPMACFAGGVVTLVCCWFVWTVPYPPWIVLLIFPGLATLVGQLGSGYMAMYAETLRCRNSFPKTLPVQSQFEPEAKRFSTRQLLGLTTVASLLLAGLQMTGLLTPHVMVRLAVWAVLQLPMLWIATKLIDGRYRRATESRVAKQ